ncbi:zinc finger MSN2 [Fusarium mexicanum]|uniref:Zinc finger MSN2 n=1 Tax=Fusarium mexicanum TaxID=751941 RepID=A0A8H5MRP0_9HYPO|nr:zinc finger MSN2 [Fusarium mexicanum]
MWMLMGWSTGTKSRPARRTQQHDQATGISRKVNYDKARNTTKHAYDCMSQSTIQNSIMDSFGALDAASFIHPGTLDSADEHRHESQASPSILATLLCMRTAEDANPVLADRDLPDGAGDSLSFTTHDTWYLSRVVSLDARDRVATGGEPRPTRPTMEARIPDDGLLFMSEEDFIVDFASNDLESLPWNAPYDTNDAAFADVHQETTFADTVDSVNTNSFNIYSDHINPTLHNTQELPAADTTYLYILPMNWDFMTTSTDPITTTLAGSITTTEQSNYSTTYTSSSSPITRDSPTGLSLSQISAPLSAKNAENAPSTSTRRRRTRMEPGTRPCDLKRQKRKEDKPEKCHICGKGHQWNRDLERHYWSNHGDEAVKMGLRRSEPKFILDFLLASNITTTSVP